MKYVSPYRLKRSINNGPWHAYATSKHDYEKFKAKNFQIGNVRFREYPSLYRIIWLFQSWLYRKFPKNAKGNSISQIGIKIVLGIIVGIIVWYITQILLTPLF